MNEKLDIIKSMITRAYADYLKNHETIGKLASLFKIPIDADRLSDYRLVNFDFNNLYCVICDKNCDIRYSAEYTNNAKILKKSSIEKNFINVKYEDSNGVIKEKIYIAGKREPIAMNAIIPFNSCYISLFKEYPNRITLNEDYKFVIEYFNCPYSDKQNSYPSLSKTYVDKYCERKFTGSYNRILTKKDNVDINQDYYIFNNNKGTIYGVNHYIVDRVINDFYGICSSYNDEDFIKYAPQRLFSSNFDRSLKATSLIRFNGITGDNTHHYIEINKDNNDIIIDYKATKLKQNVHKTVKKTLTDHLVTLPIIDKGKITSNEINSVILYLYESSLNDFIQSVILHLNNFANIIDNKFKNKIDPISPDMFIYFDFDDIVSLVCSEVSQYVDKLENDCSNLCNNQNIYSLKK